MAGEVFVGVLRRDDPGGAQDAPRVFAWRCQNVDGVVAGAVADDEPLVADDDDAGLRGGMPGGAASMQDGASPSWEAGQSLRRRGARRMYGHRRTRAGYRTRPDDYSQIRLRNLA